MLKHTELLNKLSAKQKISLLANIHCLADDEYVELGLPYVKFVTLDELFAKDGDGLTPYTLARTWDPSFITKITADIIERNCDGANVIIIPSPKINLGGEAQLALSEDPLLAAQIATAFLSAVNQCKKIGVIPDFYLTKKEIANMDIELDQQALNEFLYEPFSYTANNGLAKAVIGTLSKSDGAYEDFNRTLIRNKDKYFSPETDMLCLCKTYDETILALDENCILFTGVEIAIQNAYEQYQTTLSAIEKGRASMLDLEKAIEAKTAISDQTLNASLDKVIDFALRIQQMLQAMNPTVAPMDTPSEVPVDTTNEEPADEASEAPISEPETDSVPPAEVQESMDVAPEKPMKLDEFTILALERSTVLLKNKDNVLPLKPNKPFAIIGDAALVPPKGETMSFAQYFTKYAAGNCIGMERGYDLLENRSDNLIPAAVALAEQASTVFVFLKAPETKTSYPCTSLPANQIALINALTKCKCNVVAVLDSDINVDVSFSGIVHSLVLAPIAGQLSAKALVNVLFGKALIGGKLTTSFFVSPNKFYKRQRFYKDEKRNKISIFTGYRYYDTQDVPIHYPFGFGLKYSTIEISNATWNNGTLTFTVQNKGPYAVDETIEVYAGMEKSKLLRPKKELKAFHTVHLKAGATERVTIRNLDFKTFDEKSNARIVEKGTYILSLGTSISKIHTTLRVNINGQTFTGTPPKLSEYLQSKSNILSNNFTLEAKHNKMANYKNLKIAGFICLAVAVLIGLMSITASAPLIPLVISAVILLGAISLLVASNNLKARVEMEEAKLIEKNKKLFQNAETAANDQLEKLFLKEFKFDVSDSAMLLEESDEVYVDPTAAAFNEEMTFAIAAADLKKSAGEFGVTIDSNCAANVIASFVSSKFIIAKAADGDSFYTFVSAIANYFNANLFTETITEGHNPNDRLLYATYSDGNFLSTAVLNALISAAEKPQVMHIVYLRNLPVAKISDYLIPYVKYFSNPHSNAEISPKGSDKIYTIPSNIWFITDLEKGSLVENVPAYMLEYAALLPIKHVVGEASAVKSELVAITLTDFEFLSERCRSKFVLTEDIWKKIDAIEAFAFKHASYKIGNKLWLKIETFLSTLLSMDMEQPIAIDSALASIILPTLASALVGKLDNSDKTLIDEAERVFGEDNVQISHEMLVSKA